MKKILYILSIFLFTTFLNAQSVSFDLISKSDVAVRNNNNFSLRVLVYNSGWAIHDVILQPGGYSHFAYQYSKSEVQNISYKVVYDDKALEMDLNRIEAIKRARDKERVRVGALKALGSLIDETFFGGTFSTLFEIGNYGNMLFNGATAEEWADALIDSSVGFGIGEVFDKNYQKGLASAAYELAKSMQSQEYKDLQDGLVFFMKKRESQYIKSGYITETAKLPERTNNLYPHFSISVAYPINQKFAEDALNENVDLLSIKSEEFNEELPFELRLNYRKKSTMGFFAEYTKTNIFKNRNFPDFKYLKQGSAFRYKTYSLGITPSYSYVEFGLGISYMQQENFLIEPTGNQFYAIDKTTKWGGFIEPRININLGKPVTIFGSWKATVFSDKDIKDTWLELYYFKVGARINFRKKELDFSN